MDLDMLQRMKDFRWFMQNNNKKIVIFGAGTCCKVVVDLLNVCGYTFDYFVDNDVNKVGMTLFNHKIKSYTSLKKEEKNELLILIAVREKHYEIEKQLLLDGYIANRDFIFALEYLEYPYYDYTEVGKEKKVNQAQRLDLSKCFCPVPFCSFMFHYPNASLCCMQYLENVNFNGYNPENMLAVWNSNEAQQLRKGVLDGSYSCCKKDVCGYFLANDFPQKTDFINNPRFKEIIENNKTILEWGPIGLNIGFDDSCNLRCKMCRNDFSGQSKGEERDNLLKIIENGTFPDVKYILLAGNGDVFFQRDIGAYLISWMNNIFQNFNLLIFILMDFCLIGMLSNQLRKNMRSKLLYQLMLVVKQLISGYGLVETLTAY